LKFLDGIVMLLSKTWTIFHKIFLNMMLENWTWKFQLHNYKKKNQHVMLPHDLWSHEHIVVKFNWRSSLEKGMGSLGSE
jgi:hypothetical protein